VTWLLLPGEGDCPPSSAPGEPQIGQPLQAGTDQRLDLPSEQFVGASAGTLLEPYELAVRLAHVERLLMKGWGSAVWRRLPAVAAVVGVLGLLWVIVVVAPPWFVPDQSLEGLRAQNEVRSTLLQGLGGAALLVGAYITYRQLQTSREGQITERFTRAIDQLGSEHLDVRLGGLYALARIARDSPADRASIGEVLTAFVRTHAPWPPSLPDQPAASAPIEQVPKLQVRAPDVQASLWVLGRGGFACALGHYRWLDLSGVDLRRPLVLVGLCLALGDGYGEAARALLDKAGCFPVLVQHL
jgi:hypothetical protein